MRYISETVMLERFVGGVEDAHGNETETWAAPVELGIYAYNPSSSSDVLIDGHMHRVETKPTIYVPSTAVVGARDRITARGEAFEVDGEPSDYRNPYDSTMNGVSINLRAVDG